MKKILLSVISLWTVCSLNAQVSDVVSTSGGANSVYYSLENGIVKTSANTGWDLAFNIDLFVANIRINGSGGVEVYAYPDGDTSDFMTLDTANLDNWPRLYNSVENWDKGAFNANATSNVFDFGWGVYNPGVNTVVGDSILVVKTSLGDLKKIWVKSLTSGGYTFKYSNIDNSDMVEKFVALSGYSNKNYFYYSLDNDVILDREPPKADWDFVATKYEEFQTFQQAYYGVTGVLTSKEVSTREARNTDVTTAEWPDFTDELAMNVMGADWKSFNMSTFSYDIEEDLSYFVTDKVGDIWQVIFTDYVGGASGDISFTKEKISAVSIDEANGIKVGLYPNPAKDQVTFLYDNLTAINASITIQDLQGKVVYSNDFKGEGFNQLTVDVSFLDAGIYNVVINSENRIGTQRLVIQ